MKRMRKNKKGEQFLSECILHGLTEMCHCKEHEWNRYCSGCETSCWQCQPIWEYRQVVAPKKRYVKMSRTRAARAQTPT